MSPRLLRSTFISFNELVMLCNITQFLDLTMKFLLLSAILLLFNYLKISYTSTISHNSHPSLLSTPPVPPFPPKYKYFFFNYHFIYIMCVHTHTHTYVHVSVRNTLSPFSTAHKNLCLGLITSDCQGGQPWRKWILPLLAFIGCLYLFI